MNRCLVLPWRKEGIFVAVLLCFVAAARAQAPVEPPASPTATIQVTSKLVVLDVVVTNAQGEVVPGLKKQDFTLLQDGKVQPIRNFEGWEGKPVEEDAGNRAGAFDVAVSPLTIFVLDDLNTPFAEHSYAAFTLKRYLESLPAVMKTPAMLIVVNDRGLTTLADYTRDRDALLHALAKRPPDYPEQLENSKTLELLSESFAILRQIAIASDGLHGHKTLVWLGRGFPTVASSDLDVQGEAALQAAMRQTVTMLTRDRITMYKVDPITTNARAAATDLGTTLDLGSGMGSTANIAPVSEDPLQGDFNFNQFVVQTGGAYLYGRNDLDKFIGESLDRGSHFYTLTYVPASAAKPESYQSIHIKMRDPSLIAVTRSGFFDDSLQPVEPSIRNIGFDLNLAARASIAYNGVALHVAAVTSSATTDRVTVNYVVQDRSLTWTPQAGSGETARILTVLVALDADHKVLLTSAASLGLAVKDSREIAKGTVVTKSQIAIGAKTRSVRLLVRDSSGRIGSWDIPADTWSAH